VPTGPLTKPPKGTRPQALQNAAWLIRAHALSGLPSVTSLWALRKLAGASSAARPFLCWRTDPPRGPIRPRPRAAAALPHCAPQASIVTA